MVLSSRSFASMTVWKENIRCLMFHFNYWKQWLSVKYKLLTYSHNEKTFPRCIFRCSIKHKLLFKNFYKRRVTFNSIMTIITLKRSNFLYQKCSCFSLRFFFWKNYRIRLSRIFEIPCISNEKPSISTEISSISIKNLEFRSKN